MRVFLLLLIFFSSCSDLQRIDREPASSYHCNSLSNRFQQKALSAGFPTFSLLSHLKGENNKVTYLSEKGRQEYEVFVNCEGKLINFEGQFINSPTNSMFPKPARAIYVVDIFGRLFLSFYHPIGVFHHSSLVGGDDVLAAGEMILVNGSIDLINNHSGHYHPDESSLDLLIDVLLSLKVKINKVEL